MTGWLDVGMANGSSKRAGAVECCHSVLPSGAELGAGLTAHARIKACSHFKPLIQVRASVTSPATSHAAQDSIQLVQAAQHSRGARLLSAT